MFFWITHLVLLIKLQVVFSRIFLITTYYEVSFRKKKNLDFTKNEKISKSNIDYFNLKEDRANEEKQEKFQNFIFVSVAAVSVVTAAIIYS